MDLYDPQRIVPDEDRVLTLDQLLELARRTLDDRGDDVALLNADSIAETVCHLLGESQPCTLEAPVSDPGNRIVAIMDGENPLYEFSPGEARAYAAMLLRAADEAEGK